MYYRVQPQFEASEDTAFQFDGEIGRRLTAVTENWLLSAPDANPVMLEMFRERDQAPMRKMMPWAGEYAGKYLTHATQILRITRDSRLEAYLRVFVRDLIALQDSDGYLGPWPKAYRLGLAGPVPNVGYIWDAWGHYHAMLGLILWHDLIGDTEALACAERIAELLCTTFLDSGRRILEVEALEMNMAPYHALFLLYARTGKERYAALAEAIEHDFTVPPAGDYVRTALQGMGFYETPKPRWESLHAIQGIAERYFLTGDAQYCQAFEHLWWSMLKGDRHNNGGFTAGERAVGDPYHPGQIETCCTVAWTAMTVDMLRMTGNSIVADELELTLFNSGLGLMSPSGHWVTYDTPMEGRRISSTISLAFQQFTGSSELSCCSVNGPRVLGLLGDWALMHGVEELMLNYYGPGTMRCTLPSGNRCQFTQVTDYPREAEVELYVTPDAAEEFTLALRIPAWSEETTVTVNGEPVACVTPGAYLPLTRCWRPGDVIRIAFDFRLRYWTQPRTGHFYTDWEAIWQVFGPAPALSNGAPSLELNTITVLPSELVIDGAALTPLTWCSDKGYLDFKQLPGQRAGANMVYCFTEIDSPQEVTLPIRFSADYYTCIVVNGTTVFDGESTIYEDASLRRFCVGLPLKAGKNLIALSVRDFSYPHQDWNLSISCAEPLMPSVADENPFLVSSIYRGPLLLAFDHRYNSMDVEQMPGLDARTLTACRVTPQVAYAPWLLLECGTVNGQPLMLCDFASAGVTGNPYRTWFNVRGVQSVDFTQANPSRSMRPSSNAGTNEQPANESQR
ncbi:MAG: beta-L-arabinofuranosidase domain-containing protein [Armatimonadota bacterium]